MSAKQLTYRKYAKITYLLIWCVTFLFFFVPQMTKNTQWKNHLFVITDQKIFHFHNVFGQLKIIMHKFKENPPWVYQRCIYVMFAFCCCRCAKMKVLIVTLFCFCQAQNFGDFNNENFNRVPLYVPDKCPPNELLYPEGNSNDWVCDCAPGYVYYKPEDSCFLAYNQGPCKKYKYLVWNRKRRNNICLKNPCEDGSVIYNKQCHELWKINGPCGDFTRGGGILGVNSSTLKIECLTPQTTLILKFDVPNCLPGSRRAIEGRCA